VVLRHIPGRAARGGLDTDKVPGVGSRVHWIVIRNGHVTNRRLDGGAGMGLDYALGAGPEPAASHWDDRGELDRSWTGDRGEGGALIDADRRVLLFFTTQAPPAYRAAMLSGYRRVWAGWQVRWADGGLADFARYVGVEPAAARLPGPPKVPGQAPAAPDADNNVGDVSDVDAGDVAEALGVLADRVETYVPGDVGLRAMQEKLRAGLGARVALAALESARIEAAPAAAAAAKLIRQR
jgi:hypothetical protein